jgi:hypothetical protein
MPFDGPSKSHPDIELLQAVKNRIASRDWWVQNKYIDNHAVCLSQAIKQTCGWQSKHVRRLVARELAWAYRMPFFSSSMQIILFNDRPSTSHAQVIGLLDSAINRLRQREFMAEYEYA